MSSITKCLPTRNEVYAHLQRFHSAVTTERERVVFSNCLPYKNPTTLNKIFCAIYYESSVSASRFDSISNIANSIWSLCFNDSEIYSALSSSDDRSIDLQLNDLPHTLSEDELSDIMANIKRIITNRSS